MRDKKIVGEIWTRVQRTFGKSGVSVIPDPEEEGIYELFGHKIKAIKIRDHYCLGFVLPECISTLEKYFDGRGITLSRKPTDEQRGLIDYYGIVREVGLLVRVTVEEDNKGRYICLLRVNPIVVNERGITYVSRIILSEIRTRISLDRQERWYQKDPYLRNLIETIKEIIKEYLIDKDIGETKIEQKVHRLCKRINTEEKREVLKDCKITIYKDETKIYEKVITRYEISMTYA